MTQDEAKRLVARRAVVFVKDGMVVGLGTGTTATLFIRELAARGLKIRCVASSDASHALAESLGMNVATLAELPELDVYIDGADEVCVPAGAGLGAGVGAGLNLIKGGGGALLREKIVASAAKSFIVVADSTKLVEVLGKFPLPVEVVEDGAAAGTAEACGAGLEPEAAAGEEQRCARCDCRAVSDGRGRGTVWTARADGSTTRSGRRRRSAESSAWWSMDCFSAWRRWPW